MKTTSLTPFVAVLFFIAACAPEAATMPASESDLPLDEQPESQAQGVTLPSSGVIDPGRLEYLGAFRLPGGDERPQTFAYGGNAMTYNPDGDSAGIEDGFPGSLFVMGHDRMPYGDLPDGNQVAEINIPAPIITKDIESLNTAGFLQEFSNIAGGQVAGLDEIPRVGMQYLSNPLTGPLIHIAWGQHFQETPSASHAWISPTLEQPNMQGAWFIGDQDLYSVNGYLFEIPSPWSEEFGYLATGRARDGGWSGMGPALFAYTPWQEDGSPFPADAHLNESILLLYESSYNTEEFNRAMSGYQHPDEWEGGAWLTPSSGGEAIIFVGTKSDGDKFWYGYLDPTEPENVCVDTQITGYPTCRLADGGVCSHEDLNGCCDETAGTCATFRGWWSTHFDAQIIFFAPADLAKVARGEWESWQPQPYASLDIDEALFLNPPESELMNVGWGEQRRFRVGDVAYDRENDLLYILELYADGAKPVVHVWRVR